MAEALTFSAQTSQLNVECFPGTEVSDGDHACGPVDFQTFNSIPISLKRTILFFYGFADSLSANDVAGSVIDDGDNDPYDIEVVIGNTVGNNGDSDDSGQKAPQVNTKRKPAERKNQPLACIQLPTGSYEVLDVI